MAMNSRASTELSITKKWRQEWEKKVSVVYYISRNGHLDHPHFVEVPLSSSHGLYLRDVMNRLSILRGEGMANMYSWSSKRSYRNGFVWQDLSENDFIPPTDGGEYVLKGSELLRTSLSFRSCGKTGSSETFPGDRRDFPATITRRNRSFDRSHEYRVYKADLNGERFAGKSADKSTQAGDELSRDEATSPPPPPSSSCSVVSEGVSGSRAVDQVEDIRDPTVCNEFRSGRVKGLRVLKQLVTCGSVEVKGLCQ